MEQIIQGLILPPDQLPSATHLADIPMTLRSGGRRIIYHIVQWEQRPSIHQSSHDAASITSSHKEKEKKSWTEHTSNLSNVANVAITAGVNVRNANVAADAAKQHTGKYRDQQGGCSGQVSVSTTVCRIKEAIT
ncbi:hypothetical protein FRC19_010627 [Serendipita sp. 401]|nr:hypothetical protein FRC15_010610 [Serendipita sp. 397]KAG8818449.1 hypothetical protein FRC19_010627 [Serendipita sp. 401]